MFSSIELTSRAAARVRRALLPLLGLTAALLAATPAQADLKSVTAEVNKLYNNGRVSETLFQDLYRIDFGPNSAPFYVSESVSLILETDGNQITRWVQPVPKPTPISDEEKSGVLNAIIHNIRFDKLIQLKRGKGSNRILLLSAYDCPYCIKLERMLESAGDQVDATFYIVPATLNPRDAARQANVHNIWCADDSAATWHKGLLTANQQYAAASPGSACTWGDLDRRDMSIVLRSLGNKQMGYPFMVPDNGQPSGVEQELPLFLKQIRTGAEKQFWDPKYRAVFPVTEYAQFRADKAGPRGWYK